MTVRAAADAATLATWLRRAREIAGLTQEELAQRAGLTAKGVAAIERGRTGRPQQRTIQALAAALELSVGQRAELAALVASERRPHTRSTHDEPSLYRAPAALVSATLPPVVGRAEEVAALTQLLLVERPALVTLIGPGGVGKTRLALAVAGAVADHFPDGIYVASLAALTDPALVLPSIARSVGLREEAGPLPEALVRWAQGRRALLLLDNCEHVLDAAPAIGALGDADSGLTLLATSRAPLRLRGEREWPVAPLATATGESETAAASSPAVALFIERARAVNPGFAPSAGELTTIAQVCERLDGLPLAIELAAARTRSLTPAALLARLDRALPLLAAGPRDAPAHQRTMGDTIAWSHDLLTASERRLFRRLAVFAGGWETCAAEAVDGDGEETLVALAGLVEQSMVVAKPTAEVSTRQRLLEPIRQFAAAQLVLAGEETQARRAHADHFLRAAERAAPNLFAKGQAGALDRLSGDADNFRVALGSLLADGRDDAASRLGTALHRFWWIRGHLAEGRRWREQIVSRLDALAPPLRAQTLLTAAFLAYADSDHRGADAYLAAAIPLARDTDERIIVARALGLRGLAAHGLGEPDRARESLISGFAEAQEVGDEWAVGMTRTHLGYLSHATGDYYCADDTLARAERNWRALGSSWDLAYTINMRAAIAEWRGDFATVATLAGECLHLLLALRDGWLLPYPFEQLAAVKLSAGDPRGAARLQGAAARLRATSGARIQFAADRSLNEARLAALNAALGPERFAAAFLAGETMPLQQAIGEALTV